MLSEVGEHVSTVNTIFVRRNEPVKAGLAATGDALT